MARDEIRYRSGYKYQLVEEYSLTVSVTPDDAVEVDEDMLHSLLPNCLIVLRNADGRPYSFSN